MDEIPLEITGSILVENRAKDLPRAAREDQRGHPTCRKPTRTVFCVPEVIKLRQKPALESVFCSVEASQCMELTFLRQQRSSSESSFSES